jgi:hypothetical protein
MTLVERSKQEPRGWRNAGVFVLIALWASAVLGGEVLLWRYQLTPGAPPRPAPAAWPADGSIPRHPGPPLLLMIAHPRCTCTRASLNELRRLVARLEQLDPRPALYLSIIAPAGSGPDWTDGPVLHNASSISNLHVVIDRGGRFAAKLGATTSGHVLVYGADDRLLFSGGITSARAHEGDSIGQDAIVQALYGKSPSPRRSLVFGCGLEHRKSLPSPGDRS